MDRRKLLGLGLSLAFGIVCWALGQLVVGLRALPYLAFPMALAAMCLFGALLWFDWRREHRRQSYPGFGLHLVIRVADQRVERRRYFVHFGVEGKGGAAFYLSASDRFVFAVEDERGEPYALEIPAGLRGFPIAEVAYFSVESGTDGVRTTMRAAVNGRTVGERTLPFSIAFPPFGGGGLGSNQHGEKNAAFDLYEMISLSRTLDYDESEKMTQHLLKKHRIQS